MEKDIEDIRKRLFTRTWGKWEKEDEFYKKIENLLNELEKYKLILFMVVRNSKVLPVGLKLNKSQKEITKMTKDTIKELEKSINFEKAKEFYDL